MEFFGRQDEIAALRRIRSVALESARMTVLTGRRREGKTALVRQALDDGRMPYGRFQRARAILATACRVGFRSARERGRAVVALWLSAALVVAAYYLVPGAASALEPVGNWQRENGWLASFAFCAVFCGAIPYVVYLLRGERGQRGPLATAVAQAVWCGLCGIVCGWFFALQGQWFGSGHDLATVLKKVMVDQFGWSVLVIVPGTAVFYAVLSGGWRVKDERVPFGTFVREAYLPTLVMNWIVGIPSNCAVYAFPMDLQIPVLGLLSSAWAVICVGLGAHSGRAIHAAADRMSSRIRS